MPEINWDFKGLWIPKEIWLADDLQVMEKLVFAMIYHLDNEKGCWMSNRSFAKFFDVSERQIPRYISRLKELGLVKVTVKNRTERTIRVIGKFANVPDADFRKFDQLKSEIAESKRQDWR